MSALHIGQKVVCIDDYFAPEIARLYRSLPTENTVYVIRGIHSANHYDDGKPAQCLALLLVGLVNPCLHKEGAKERGFNANRFRPLQEMKDREKVARLHVERQTVNVNA